MRGRRWIVSVGSAALVFGALASLHACSDDPAPSSVVADGGLSPRQSRKGEVCQATADCVTGLSCVPSPGASGLGICVTGEFKVTANAKVCSRVQCERALDCCPLTNNPSCPSLKQQCDLYGTIDGGSSSGSSSICTYYQQTCTCDETRWRCDQGTCASACKTDSECLGSSGTANKCSAGKCVQCLADTDCTAGNHCESGICRPPCTSDSECPGFNRCANGACVSSGCKTDRECVAGTRNVEAVCKDTKCVIPCQTDLECGNPKAYQFYSCIQNECVYTGCESDKDCELYFLQGQDGGLPLRTKALCRDKQ